MNNKSKTYIFVLALVSTFFFVVAILALLGFIGSFGMNPDDVIVHPLVLLVVFIICLPVAIFSFKSIRSTDKFADAVRVKYQDVFTKKGRLIQSTSDEAATLTIDSKNQTLSITSGSGKLLVNARLQNITKLSFPMSPYVQAAYIDTDKQKIVFSFFEDQDEYQKRRKYVVLALFFGFYAVFLSNLSTKSIFDLKSNTNEELHYWLATHPVNAYKNHLSPNARVMAVFAAIPLFAIIAITVIGIFFA